MSELIVVDSFEPSIKIGSAVRVVSNLGEKTRGRKAILIDIDDLSSMGSYRDMYTIKMVKSGEEIDCVRDNITPW